MSDIEYIDIQDIRDCFIARWLKKPKTVELQKARKMIAKKGIKLNIGISTTLIDRIIEEFNGFRKNNLLFGEDKFDLSHIACKLQIPVALIRVVLEYKGVLKCKR